MSSLPLPTPMTPAEFEAYIQRMAVPERQSLLVQAAQEGRVEMLPTLIAMTDPAAEESMALRHAAWRNEIEAFRLLLPHSDPAAMYADALYGAAWRDHQEMLQLLLPHLDLAHALSELNIIPEDREVNIAILNNLSRAVPEEHWGILQRCAEDWGVQVPVLEVRTLRQSLPESPSASVQPRPRV